jgi:DNA polymerase-3 subunit alpha
MNESHDKYRHLFVPNQTILVVGEVYLGDDKPKLFPQEIMPLEDAPSRFTKQVHLRLNTAHLTPDRIETVRAITARYPGRCPLFLCFRHPTGSVLFVEANDRFGVAPSRELQKAIDEEFGNDTYYAKVDVSLPERQTRRWSRTNGEAAEVRA